MYFRDQNGKIVENFKFKSTTPTDAAPTDVAPTDDAPTDSAPTDVAPTGESTADWNVNTHYVAIGAGVVAVIAVAYYLRNRKQKEPEVQLGFKFY